MSDITAEQTARDLIRDLTTKLVTMRSDVDKHQGAVEGLQLLLKMLAEAEAARAKQLPEETI